MFKFLFSLLLTLPLFGDINLEEMTLEEKVGQLLIVQFHGEIANEEAKELISDLNVSGFIYYNWANGLHSVKQVADLSLSLQKQASQNRHPIPLFISVDQEGGQVCRLMNGFTHFPSNRAVSQTHEKGVAHEIAFEMGEELKSVGVNLNFAPVCDVATAAQGAINIRSFGGDPELVFSFCDEALQGYKRAEILACIKHFPGLGGVVIDSHDDLPKLTKTKEELLKCELLPFYKLANETDLVMTGHILVPALDPETCATLSKPILSLLREEGGFKGAIISDSLVMEGLTKKGESLEELSIKAFDAGCDLLLLGGRRLIGKESVEIEIAKIKSIHTALTDAFHSGRLEKKRLDASLERIFALKRKFPKTPSSFDSTAHAFFAKKIATQSIETSVQKRYPFKKWAIVADAKLESVLKDKGAYFFDEKGICENVDPFDVLFICTYNAFKNKEQLALIDRLSHTKEVVLIAAANPIDATFFPEIKHTIKTFSPTKTSLEVALNQLTELISDEMAEKMGERVFKNETGGKEENLTFWNKKEPFPSLGIAHFIWYPDKKKDRFEELFPQFLTYLEKEHENVPVWLKEAKGCPWDSYETFYASFNSPKMVELRTFLLKTKKLQATFLAERFKATFLSLPDSLKCVCEKVALERGGLFALVDYLNFKGTGLTPSENYLGQGWGLKHVLERMDPNSSSPLEEFVLQAKAVLVDRVKNAGPSRKEHLFLPGWMNRIDGYLEPL